LKTTPALRATPPWQALAGGELCSTLVFIHVFKCGITITTSELLEITNDYTRGPCLAGSAVRIGSFKNLILDRYGFTMDENTA
jgi:hypothetical protein